MELPLPVVVNADDIGASQEINEAVESAANDGLLSSGSLLAKGTAVDDAIARLQGAPDIELGLHLDLVEHHDLPFPVRGRDPRLWTGAARDAVGLPSTDRWQRLIDECRTQAKRIAEQGVRISHIDSHYHVHTRPWMLPVVARLYRETPARTVRISRNFFRSAERPRIPKRLGKALYNRALRYRLGTWTADVFTDVRAFVEDYRRLRRRNPSVVEVMCHPGHPEYPDDLRYLEKVGELARAGEIRITNYVELDEERSGQA